MKNKTLRNPSNKLKKLMKMVNSRSESPVPVNRQLLAVLDAIIEPGEIDYLISFGAGSRTRDEAFRISGMTEQEFGPFFEKLIGKAALWPTSESGPEKFALSPMFHGFVELQFAKGEGGPEKLHLARLVNELFDSWKKMNFFPLRTIVNTLIKYSSGPCHSIASILENEQGRELNLRYAIQPSSGINSIIEHYGDAHAIAIMHCFCRQIRRMNEEGCRLNVPVESCILIGFEARNIVRFGLGRYISKEDALQKIREVQSRGAVHVVFHDRENVNKPRIAVCNCCWDCCGLLGSYNRGILPLHLKSFHLARVMRSSQCIHCGKCVSFCPVSAVSLDSDGVAIDSGKCIGCGQCTSKCPGKVLGLEKKERNVFLPMLIKSRIRD